MQHHFEVEVAVKVGTNAAVLFDNIGYWVIYNQASETNIVDGKAWTYNSVKTYSELFPYLTAKQIMLSFAKLKEAGLIETGCFNADPKNRTTWYTLSDYGMSIYKNTLEKENGFSQKGKSIDFPKKENGFSQKGKSSNTDIKHTDINTDIKPEPPEKEKQDVKHIFGEYKHVRLTGKEYDKLCNDFGEQTATAAIKFLDEYIEEKGYKSKSHNLAIRRWVIDAVRKNQSRRKASGDYDWNAVLQTLKDQEDDDG